MKVVGFELEGQLRLGLLDRDEVIDLQAGDPSIPTDLGELLRRSEGDLSLLADVASRAPSRTLSRPAGSHCIQRAPGSSRRRPES